MSKTFCKTNLRKAMRKSWDTCSDEMVCDDWSVWVGRWSNVTIYNLDTGESFSSPNIWGCYSMTEFIDYTLPMMMELYEKWLAKQPKKVASIFDATCWGEAKPFFEEVWFGNNKLEESVLENCIWGWQGMSYGFDYLIENEWHYGLPIERAKELWRIAYWYVAEGCMEEDYAA